VILVNKVEVIPGISDHEIVYIESSLRPDKIKKPPRKVYLYNKMNHTLMRQGLAEVDSVINEVKTNDISIDDLWNKAVPTKTINSNKKRLPWITKEIKALT